MLLKNKLIRALTNFWKRWKKPNERDPNHQRFLIVSTTGLGDTLWGTPAIKALRQTHPNAYIAVLTSPIGEEILKHNPFIDDLFVVKKPTLLSLFRIFFSLYQQKIQTAFIFHISQRPILPFCIFLGASEIIGTEKINKGLDFLLTKPLPPKPTHEIERRLNIISEKKPAIFQGVLELYLSQDDEEIAFTFLKKYNLPDYVPLVGLHPGAKDGFKRWPAELFAQVGNRLQDHLGCQIIVSGDLSEKALVEKIVSLIPGAIAICGDLPLRPFAALIKKMSVFISNDTGPMHTAFAMYTPTVALFTPTDPKLCGPYLAPNVHVIRKPPTCTPCLRKKCEEPFCLLQISPDEVYEAALKLYHARQTAMR